MRRQFAIRSMVLVVGLAIVGFAIIVQMVRIQNSDQAKIFLSQGDLYAGEFSTIYPERGEIYDRNGHLLAGNRTVYEVGVNLKAMKDPKSLAYILGTYLGLTYDEVYNKLTDLPDSWEYIVIQDYVGADTVTSLQQLMQQERDANSDKFKRVGI